MKRLTVGAIDLHISNDSTQASDSYRKMLLYDHVSAALLVRSTISLVWVFTLYLLRYSLAHGDASRLMTPLSS